MAHSEQTTNKKKMPGVSELRLFLTFVIELCKLCMEVLDGIVRIDGSSHMRMKA